MFPYQPLTRTEFSRWLRPHGWIAIGLLTILMALSLVG